MNLRSHMTTDLQSAPFDHSGTPPEQKNSARSKAGAGDGTRTRDLLITSQLLYLLSYASDAKNAPVKKATYFAVDGIPCQ